VLTLEDSTAADVGAPEQLVLGLGRERISGRVALDAALARRIVDVALGISTDELEVGRLGLGARGVVAGFVASALHALGAPLTVSLVAPDVGSLRDEDIVGIAVRVTAAGGDGWARLEIPRRWLADASRAPADAAAMGALTFEAVVALARTKLSAGELETLVVGDAVVFDGVRAAAAAEAWPARVVVGAPGAESYAAEAVVSRAADVTIAREFVRAPTEEGFMETRARGSVVNGTPVGETTMLASAPIEIVAELARVTLRGDEVLGLGPGAVLRLAGTRGTSVALRVGGEIWAEGELVDVDGELGVRVTTSLRPR
jgi:type III secretion protein Q